MDLLAGIILLAVVVLFVGIALDAAYHKQRLPTWRCCRTGDNRIASCAA